MFDFEKFNNELDEQNAALESLLADLDDGIDEGYFSPATEMLSKVSDRLEECYSAQECYDLLTNLNVEIGKFNDSIEAMKIAAEQFQVDDDKETLSAGIAPAVESLTNTYNIISMENVTTVGDAEIQTLRDFLTGSNDLIQNKIDELEGGFTNMYGMESYLDFEDDLDLDLESYMDFDDDDEYFDIAEEGLGDKLKAAKEAVIRFLTGILNRIRSWISNLKKQNQTETDPKVKAETNKTINESVKLENQVAGYIPQVNKVQDASALQTIENGGKRVNQQFDAIVEARKAKTRSGVMDSQARKAAKNLSIKEQNEQAEKRKQTGDDYLANQIANKREGNARKRAIIEEKRKKAEADRIQKEKDAEWAEVEARVKAKQDEEDRAKIAAAAKFKATEIKKSKNRQRYEQHAGGRKKNRGGKRKARHAHESYMFDDEYEADVAIEALMDAEEGFYGVYEDDYDDFEIDLEADMMIAEEGVSNAVAKFKVKLEELCDKMMKSCRTHMERSEAGSKGEKFWSKMYTFIAGQKSKLVSTKISEDQQEADAEMERMQKINEDLERAYATMKNRSYAAESYLEDYVDEVEEALEKYLYALEDYSDALEAYSEAFGYIGTEQDFIDLAMEGIISGNQKQQWMIKYGSARKELAALTKSAKKAYKAKDYKKAIAIYKKVEVGYISLLKVAKNMPDTYASDYMYNGTTYSKLGMAKSGAIEWVNKKISSAQAAIMKCQEKMKKAANESFYGFDDDDDFDLGLESMFDEDDLDLFVGDDYDI